VQQEHSASACAPCEGPCFFTSGAGNGKNSTARASELNGSNSRMRRPQIPSRAGLIFLGCRVLIQINGAKDSGHYLAARRAPRTALQ
jgi:hypothetical protein